MPNDNEGLTIQTCFMAYFEAWRGTSKLNQKEIAQIFGFSQSLMSRILRGEGQLTPDKMEQFAAYLGMSIVTLLQKGQEILTGKAIEPMEDTATLNLTIGALQSQLAEKDKMISRLGKLLDVYEEEEAREKEGDGRSRNERRATARTLMAASIPKAPGSSIKLAAVTKHADE